MHPQNHRRDKPRLDWGKTAYSISVVRRGRKKRGPGRPQRRALAGAGKGGACTESAWRLPPSGHARHQRISAGSRTEFRRKTSVLLSPAPGVGRRITPATTLSRQGGELRYPTAKTGSATTARRSAGRRVECAQLLLRQAASGCQSPLQNLPETGEVVGPEQGRLIVIRPRDGRFPHGRRIDKHAV